MLFVFFSALYVNAAEPDAEKSQRPADKTELHISNDGNALVDQNGNEVARFVEGMRIHAKEGASNKLQGCMCCTDDCLIYDQNGQCIKPIRSCTWDFDCGCR